jgi:hypothetical protein
MIPISEANKLRIFPPPIHPLTVPLWFKDPGILASYPKYVEPTQIMLRIFRCLSLNFQPLDGRSHSYFRLWYA